ncbi:hypothetical protein LEC33_26235, partial [Salmonella enterica]|nr:hypothetical protein [Salmonella enterica]MDJ7338984.1 hypothetical protein [Salmonella enterica]
VSAADRVIFLMRESCGILVLLSQKIQINLLTVNNFPDLLNIHDLSANPVAGKQSEEVQLKQV